MVSVDEAMIATGALECGDVTSVEMKQSKRKKIILESVIFSIHFYELL